MNKKLVDEKSLIESIKKDLGIKPMFESYVTQAKVFNLSTELLSSKSLKAQQEIFDNYVKTLNEISAKLDTANREEANSYDSKFRSLKEGETYNLNASFLTALYFENIADPHSSVSMDTLPYLRLERDFGTFDAWQEDFIACAMSSRSGWAVTVYNGFLKRYMNTTIDLNSTNAQVNSYPLIVLNMWEYAYYRDYLKDKKTYIFAMMKELNWDTIESRFKKAEKIAKILG